MLLLYTIKSAYLQLANGSPNNLLLLLPRKGNQLRCFISLMVSHRIILIYTAKGYKQFLRPRANINRIIIIFLIDNNEKIALHSTVVRSCFKKKRLLYCFIIKKEESFIIMETLLLLLLLLLKQLVFFYIYIYIYLVKLSL